VAGQAGRAAVLKRGTHGRRSALSAGRCRRARRWRARVPPSPSPAPACPRPEERTSGDPTRGGRSGSGVRRGSWVEQAPGSPGCPRATSWRPGSRRGVGRVAPRAAHPVGARSSPGDVVDEPVGPRSRRGRVGVLAQEGERLRSGGHASPGQGRGEVVAVGGVGDRDPRAVLEGVGGEGDRYGRRPPPPGELTWPRWARGPREATLPPLPGPGGARRSTRGRSP